MLSLILLTSTSIVLGDEGVVADSPPWAPRIGHESEVSGQSPGFDECREALRKIWESHSVALIDSTTYWESDAWGHTIRQAGLYSDNPIHLSRIRVVCWTKLGDTQTWGETLPDTDILRDWTPD